MNIYYIVYKTTNLVNGKFYIGKHKTKNLNDTYLGSGKVLKEAIKKYGRENFEREILSIFDNETEAFEYEAKIVTEQLVNSSNSYNLSTGGLGGRTHHSETKKILSERGKGRTPWNKGISTKPYLSTEHYKNAIKNLTDRVITKDEIERRKQSRDGYSHSEETKKKIGKKLKGRKFSEETRKKMSESAKNRKT